jgi:hypothetical protein
VSHQPERKHRDCLNCGNMVFGKYCHICGQENIEIHQNIFGLTRHFIYDIFHFDGKFFDTLRYLLTRPGYIPGQYIKGKRQSFLDPIRMYLFTSAIFFIIFFAVRGPGTAFTDDGDIKNLSRTERFNLSYALYSDSNSREDDINRKKLSLLLDTSYSIYLAPPDSMDKDQLEVEKDGKVYKLLASRENFLLIDSGSQDWVSKELSRKFRIYKRKFGDDTGAMISDFSTRFMHKLPYVLFVSLPLFALILKLLYRRRKDLLFADHAVFTLYHYILSFILLLFFFLVFALKEKLDWSILSFLSGGLLLSIPAYLFIALRKFYGEGMGKTILKFLLLNSMAYIVTILLLLLFIILSIIQI